LVSDAVEAVRRGPSHPGFHRIVIGARGTGKTVALQAMLDAAGASSKVVVARWTAGSVSLAEALAIAEVDAAKALTGRVRRSVGRIDASATIGVPGVVSASASARERAGESRSSFVRLQRMASRARDRKLTVVLWVDEAQLADRAEIATLAGVMQQLANVERYPIAVWAAGLPETRPRWIDASSPLERQRFTVLENLGRDDAAAAFEIPIIEAGRRIAPDALEYMVVESLGFPYVIQLMGSAAWEAARGEVIDLDAVRIGVAAAVTTMQDQLFVARWRRMSPLARDVLAAAAELERHGLVSSSEVAARLGMSTQQLSKVRQQLIEQHQVLASPARGQLEFTQPGLAEWVRAQRHRPGGPSSPNAALRRQLGELRASERRVLQRGLDE
jgi:hypothetical protein